MNNNEMIETIELLCRSKIEELELLGYQQVGIIDVWACVNKRYTKLEHQPSLHQIVNDILTLKAQDLMNYLTVQAWQDPTIQV